MSPMPGPATGTTLADLTPTEGLILDVVTSRYALGHSSWTIDRINRRALEALRDRGLVTFESGVTEGVFDVSPTLRALALCLTGLQPPALDPACRSAYFGPKSRGMRVDCAGQARHPEDHSARLWDGGPVVEWTTPEAWGRDDPYWAEQIARADALFAVDDPCPEQHDYDEWGMAVACALGRGHDTRHLWPGDREQPWIKPVAWA